ncbi:hypothetical protein OAQ84_00475 [Bdellovibrionales bacterium]|nr:hypothetical protein [Bdellovibrionales bacterium]
MVKWVEVASSCSRQRFELLSRLLKEECGLENSVEFLEGTKDEFDELITKATSNYDFIRIGTGYGESVVHHFPFSSEKINILKSADLLIPISGRWWSRSATFHGLQKCLSSVGGQLDTDQNVLIAGAGAISRAIIATFVKMGFKKFNITNYQEEPVHALIEDIHRHYFGINCQFVPVDDLILLSGNHNAVANTTPYSEDNELLSQLYYFNYLSSGGITIDFVLGTRDTPFIQEARAIGATVVEGYEIASWADAVWAKWCFNIELDRDLYNEELKKILPAAPSIAEK